MWYELSHWPEGIAFYSRTPDLYLIIRLTISIGKESPFLKNLLRKPFKKYLIAYITINVYYSSK